MAVTVDSFLEDFTEFARTPEDLVQAKLNAVEVELSTTEWGDHRDQAVKLRVAHALSLSPHGERARREGSGVGRRRRNDDDVTQSHYLDEYIRLRKRVMVPLTVSGGF